MVMLGVMKQIPKLMCAMKYLVPTSCVHAHAEIRALQIIGKHPNVIELLTSVRYQDQVVLVFPYFEHDNFTCLMETANLVDIKFYMHSLLNGLAHIHSKGIIHRDIKPSNFLYKKEFRTGKLIDFGLVNNLPNTGNRVFKKPCIPKKKLSVKPKYCCHDCVHVCEVCMSRKLKKVCKIWNIWI